MVEETIRYFKPMVEDNCAIGPKTFVTLGPSANLIQEVSSSCSSEELFRANSLKLSAHLPINVAWTIWSLVAT